MTKSVFPFSEFGLTKGYNKVTIFLRQDTGIIPPPMNKSLSFDLVIFDCDGVLVNSEPLANQVYVHMLGEFGHQVDAEQYLREFSGAYMSDRLEVTSQRLNWTPPGNFLPTFHKRFSALVNHELQAVSGIHSLIESLSVPICVASNGSREEIALRLKIAKLTDHFGDAIFSGMEVPHPKPEPDVFLAAAKAFNVSPARCIVIEDSVPGVIAAVRAGMQVYGYAACTPGESLRKAGAIPFSNMAELQTILSDPNKIAIPQ
jgi:HAD superfamily hydrolase (TIGR01509 family)